MSREPCTNSKRAVDQTYDLCRFRSLNTSWSFLRSMELCTDVHQMSIGIQWGAKWWAAGARSARKRGSRKSIGMLAAPRVDFECETNAKPMWSQRSKDGSACFCSSFEHLESPKVATVGQGGHDLSSAFEKSHLFGMSSTQSTWVSCGYFNAKVRIVQAGWLGWAKLHAKSGATLYCTLCWAWIANPMLSSSKTPIDSVDGIKWSSW